MVSTLDLIFPRAHAGAAVAGLCAAATTGALATGGAAVVTVAALAAAVLVAGTLTPSQAFGPIIERAVGADGSVVEIRGQHGESRAVMTATDASGNEVVFELIRLGDGYVLWDAFRLDGTGAVLPMTPIEAIGLSAELFGPVGGGFTEHRNDGMTVITPVTEQLPLIFVTPEVRQEGFALSTPATPQRPLDLITTAPDVDWVTAWESVGFYEPRRWRENYEAFYGSDVTSSTVPPYSKPNVRKAGQRHPETGVVFDQRGCPVFDPFVTYDTRITSDEFRKASHRQQMRMATEDLRVQIQNNEQLRLQFSEEQRSAINRGSAKIPSFTWHHHQDSGRMQLVLENIHKQTGHVGGDAMSGGR